MNAFGLVLALMKLAAAVLDHIERRRLLSEAEERAWLNVQNQIDAAMVRARRARKSVDPGGVPDDANNRDNWPGF